MMNLISRLVIRLSASARDKTCLGCGWTARTSLDYCPRCGRELTED